MDVEDFTQPLPLPEVQPSDLVDIVDLDGVRRTFLVMERTAVAGGCTLDLLADPENV
jgi:hypothetical protein